MRMINEIIKSTWPACTEPQPSDPDQVPFIADAVIKQLIFIHPKFVDLLFLSTLL